MSLQKLNCKFAKIVYSEGDQVIFNVNMMSHNPYAFDRKFIQHLFLGMARITFVQLVLV